LTRILADASAQTLGIEWDQWDYHYWR